MAHTRPGTQRVGVFYPVNAVRADCVAPVDVHAAVENTEGVMLIIEMIVSAIKDQAVWIVYPPALGRKVISRTQRLVIEIGIQRVIGGDISAFYDAVEQVAGGIFSHGKGDLTTCLLYTSRCV